MENQELIGYWIAAEILIGKFCYRCRRTFGTAESNGGQQSREGGGFGTIDGAHKGCQKHQESMHVFRTINSR